MSLPKQGEAPADGTKGKDRSTQHRPHTQLLHQSTPQLHFKDKERT